MKKNLTKFLIALAVLAVVGFIFLDSQVQYNLNERQWQLPARVYSRPLTLSVNMAIEPEDIVYELKLLGYSETGSWRDPGFYQFDDGVLRLHTRSFSLSTMKVNGIRVQLTFANGRIAELVGPAGETIAEAVLEPVEIGSIYPRHSEDRVLVQIADVPQQLIDILLLIEDRNFYSHWGLSIKSIGRALLANLSAGKTMQGGSTLTQQLVKNIFLTNERSIWRKLVEAMMALQVEWHYDKDEILESYLNEVYLGQEGPRAIHGFALASRHYFNRPLVELDAGQVALLVGLVKGPSYYDPWRNRQRAIERRNIVLQVMLEHQLISEQQHQQFMSSPLRLAKADAMQGVYPAYIDLVRRQLRRDYSESDLQTQGMKILTPFDPIVQRKAEQAILDMSGNWVEGVQAAMVVTSVERGDIVAVVGGKNMRFAGFNRALDAIRPVGSLIKPAVYLTALENPSSYTLASSISDSPIEIKGTDGSIWKPRNFDRQHHGDVLLHQALAKSYNVATARLGMALGLKEVSATIERLGVDRPILAVPSMLIGSTELSVMDVATMYQTIAANGIFTPLRSIVEVSTNDDAGLARYPINAQIAFDERSMHLLHYSMMEVVNEGTGRGVYRYLEQDYKVAGKTGSSNDLRDSWFAGFAGDYLAVVWLGQDDNQPIGLTGAQGALQVWSSFMRDASEEPLSFSKPIGIVYHWIDEVSGLRSGAVCEGARYVPFIQGSAPEAKADCKGDIPGVIRWFKGLFGE